MLCDRLSRKVHLDGGILLLERLNDCIRCRIGGLDIRILHGQGDRRWAAR